MRLIRLFFLFFFLSACARYHPLILNASKPESYHSSNSSITRSNRVISSNNYTQPILKNLVKDRNNSKANSSYKTEEELPIVHKGSEVIITPFERSSLDGRTKKEKIDLDLEGADLLDFLDFTLGQTLKLNYALDPQARAKITVHIHGNFNPAELLEIIRAVLELHNLDLIKEKKLWKIIPIQKIGAFQPEVNFLAVRPHYISAQSIQIIIKQFASSQAKVLVEPKTNLLVVIDREKNLKRILKIINALDREDFIHFYYRIYSTHVLSAEHLARYIEQMLRAPALRPTNISQRVTIVPIKELDNILIAAKNEEDLKTIWNILEELDQGELNKEEIFVYQVENGDAEEIARILENIFSDVKISKRKTIIKAKQSKTINPYILQGNIKIVPDKTNNLLIIRANKEDYRRILKILEKIDVIPRQVVIEVLIAEITLNKALEYGLEWFLKTEFKLEGKSLTGQAVFSRENRGPLSLASEATGFTYALFRKDALRALLYALSSVSRVNILSNPVLLATDNKEAKIQIGREVPIITQKVTNTSSTVPTIISNVQYRDTGIILQVKPHINSSGLVKLDIVQEVSTAQKNYLGLEESPLFTKRHLETSLVVEDGQTVILGGLIDTRREIGKSGIPVLRRIPGIGHFFEWTKSQRDKTELFIAITPHVVRSRAEAERVMKDFKRRIEELKRKLQDKAS